MATSCSRKEDGNNHKAKTEAKSSRLVQSTGCCSRARQDVLQQLTWYIDKLRVFSICSKKESFITNLSMFPLISSGKLTQYYMNHLKDVLIRLVKTESSTMFKKHSNPGNIRVCSAYCTSNRCTASSCSWSVWTQACREHTETHNDSWHCDHGPWGRIDSTQLTYCQHNTLADAHWFIKQSWYLKRCLLLMVQLQ